MFKRKKKTAEKKKRLLEQELEITTYEEDEGVTDSQESNDTPIATKPDNGYPEIGPSYQQKEMQEEPVTETDLEVQPTTFEPIEDQEDEFEEDLNELESTEEPTKEPVLEDPDPVEGGVPYQPLDEETPAQETSLPIGWEWADADSDIAEEEPIQAPDFILEDIPEEEESATVQEFTLPSKDKVDLNEFFEASKEQKKLKRREKKQYSRKELKRRKKRQSRSRVPDDIRDQKVFLFRKKRYKNVEDFIQYLNDHYLDIDDIAREVLADENFFGFVGKKSGVFPQSLQEFREIKKKIEGNE